MGAATFTGSCRNDDPDGTGQHLPQSLLFVLGGLGPLVGTLFVVRSMDPAYRRDFLRRLWDPRRIPGSRWLALAAVSVVPALAGYLAAVAAGRPPTAETAVTLGAVVFTIGFALAAGAVEEPGWRGVALDLLQVRVSPTLAAILIGIPWALWHLPLFFLEGTYQHALGFGSARFWMFSFFLLPLSVLYAWLCSAASCTPFMAYRITSVTLPLTFSRS